MAPQDRPRRPPATRDRPAHQHTLKEAPRRNVLWTHPSGEAQTGMLLLVATRERIDRQPEVLRAPGQINTQKQVQDLGASVARGGLGEEQIDHPLHLRDPEQGPGPPPIKHARTRDDPRRRRRCIPSRPRRSRSRASSRLGSAQRIHSRVVGKHSARKGSERKEPGPVSMSRSIGRRTVKRPARR